MTESEVDQYDPAEVEFSDPPRFREGLRTAVARGTHPEVEDAIVLRHFGADVIEPTMYKDDEKLLDPTIPEPSVTEEWDARLEADGYYAVLVGYHDGHRYRVQLEARDDVVIGPDGEEENVSVR